MLSRAEVIGEGRQDRSSLGSRPLKVLLVDIHSSHKYSNRSASRASLAWTAGSAIEREASRPKGIFRQLVLEEVPDDHS